MAGKECTTTQPGDFSNDRFERSLAKARAALRRSKEASAAAQTAQTHHDKKWQERQLAELKEVKESRRQTRQRMAEVHKVWMGIFSPLKAKATETLARKAPAKKQAPLRPPRPKVVPIGDMNELKRRKSLTQAQAAAELGLNSNRQVRYLLHDGKLTKTAKGRVAVDDKFEEQSRLRHSARPK